MKLPDPVLIPTETPTEYAAATQAAFLLDNLVEQHNVQRKADRHALEVREAEDQFLWGQDFDIEPEVWDDEDLGEAIEAYLRNL